MSGIGNNLLLQFYRIHTFMLFTVFSGCPLTPIRQNLTDQLRVSDIKVTTIINWLMIGLSNLNCTFSLSYTNKQNYKWRVSDPFSNDNIF